MSDARDQTKQEVEGATPDDDDIVQDVPNNPGSSAGGDLNEAGSEPAGRGE